MSPIEHIENPDHPPPAIRSTRRFCNWRDRCLAADSH